MNLDVDRIKVEAKRITDEKLLAVISLTNITLTRIGGYNARPYSDELELAEGFRTSEVKGIWRWWLRAALAGALWDSGKQPDAKQVTNVTKSLLGSTESASKFTLAVRVNSSQLTNFPEDTRIPRIKLLMMGKNRDARGLAEENKHYQPNSLNVDLFVYERLDGRETESARRLVFGTLLLALLLHGLGAITKRGFGRFQLSVEKVAAGLQAYKQVAYKIQNAKNDVGMKKAFDELLSQIANDGRRFLGITIENDDSTRVSRPLPEFPVLSRNSNVFKIKFLTVRAKDEYALLEKIGNATLKLRWKWLQRLRGITGVVFDTWILGLPRKVGNTGYESQNTERRPSAIAMAPLKKLNEGYLLALYGFLSADWPSNDLIWKGSKGPVHVFTGTADVIRDLLSEFRIPQKIANCLQQKGEQRIRCAFDIAFNLVERSLLS